MRSLLYLYLVGVVVGLWRVDAPPLRKVLLAVGWPVGLAAAGVVLVLLSGAALLLFPALAGVVAAGAILAWVLW